MDLGLMLLSLVILGEIALGIHPKADRTTWILENVPIFILIPILIRLQPKVRLTRLTMVVLTFHAFVLMIGGHYTYAEVPAGFWVKDAFDLSRNHYDRLGHFMQGFGPALALKELLLKRFELKNNFLLPVIVVSMCLAFSAFYEMIEWWSALLMGQGSDAFLGTQGDPWDTQWDMFLALVGALTATLLLGKWHDRLLIRQKSI